jgi:hypothetical protein
MEKIKDKLFSESLGKTISVYYNDTLNSVSFKVGNFLAFDSYNIKLLEEGTGRLTIIPRSKCIRIEIVEVKQLEKATAK